MPTEPTPTKKPIMSASAALASAGITAESPEEQEQLNEQFLKAAFAQLGQITGLTFDWETGECTTPGNVVMEGETQEKWKQLVTEFANPGDSERAEQVLRDTGSLLRSAIKKTPSPHEGY
jgi:hypothetical protein